MKIILASIAFVSLSVSGCATAPASADSGPNDPFERFNRHVFEFNDTVDQAAIQPVARAYSNVFPSFVQTGVSNFFGNLGDVWTAANEFLQGDFGAGLSDVMRVSLNSTFGIAGLLDIASAASIPKHSEDFGKTLGVWGFPDGPYVVLPFLGPSTVRDAIGTPFDFYGDPFSYTKPVDVRNSGTVVRAVNKRAGLLDASSLLDDAALDKYIFVRDGYLQRRASQVELRLEDRQDKKDDAAAAAATAEAVKAVTESPEEDPR